MNNKKRQNSDNISLSSQPRSDFLKRQPSVESIKSINIDSYDKQRNIVLGSSNEDDESDEEDTEGNNNESEIIFESLKRDNDTFNPQNGQRNYNNNMKGNYETGGVRGRDNRGSERYID